MNWNFIVLVNEGPDLTYTIEGLDVAYIPGLPNDLVVQHILSCVLDGCNPLLCVMSYNMTLMCNLCNINNEWR